VKDSTGQAATMFDWTDTRVLDYKNLTMQDSMINAMKFWITNTKIDGFRCDVAWNVPGSFWSHCIQELKKSKSDVFMLAEGDNDYLHRSGFDATYPWEMFKMMIKVAAGERPAVSLDSIKQKYDTLYPSSALEMFFTSNHDENSWNKAEYGVFEGAKHAPFAVFTQTMARSVPLVYSGQEIPNKKRLKFFVKDPIEWTGYEMAGFYETMLKLRKTNPALASDAAFRRVTRNGGNDVLVYIREKNGKKVLTLLNLSSKNQNIIINDNAVTGKAIDVFTNKTSNFNDKENFNLAPWGFQVFDFNITTVTRL
jgi:glycosidase